MLRRGGSPPLLVLVALVALVALALAVRSDGAAEVHAQARACVQGKAGGRLFFLHCRKAGGTAMRRWLARAWCAHGRTFTGFASEGTLFNTSQLASQPTVFVTVLRHPLDRIESSYLFEGRWPQKDHRHRPEDAKSIAEFVAHALHERRRHGGTRIWVEVENYYVQLFSGVRVLGGSPTWRSDPAAKTTAQAQAGPPAKQQRQQPVQPPPWERLYGQAQRVLAQFDMVLITEWMNHPWQCQLAVARLGLNATGCDSSASNSMLAHVNANPAHRRHSALSAWDRAQLTEWNKWDLRLYEFAKNLTTARRRAWLDQGGPAASAPSPSVEVSDAACAVDPNERWAEPFTRFAWKHCGGEMPPHVRPHRVPTGGAHWGRSRTAPTERAAASGKGMVKPGPPVGKPDGQRRRRRQ